MITKHLLNEKYIASKLPHACLRRNELLKAFENSSENRLIFVSAPAGYGKTVSAQLWLADSGRETIWVTLDGYDNTPTIFYKLFCKGIISVQPDNILMKNILASATFASSPVEHTIRILAEFAPDGREYALVLDDMHSLTNKELLKSWLLVRKRLPLSFITLILTRNEISKDYTVGLEDGRYAVLSTKDLAFSEDEIRRFFISYGHPVTMDEAKIVHTFTGGWAIGVNALALSGKIEVAQDSMKILGSYIKSKIWDLWDQDLQLFMMKTAITDEMPVNLCQSITGRSDSQQILDTLCSANSFISRLSEDVYMYHNLFLEFLRGQAEEYDIDTKEYYKIAAEYYIEQGDYFIARRYAYRSGDADLMIRVIHQLNQFGKASLDEFVSFSKVYADESPPEAVCDKAPFLYSILMWEQSLRGNASKMEFYLDKLYRFLPVIAKTCPQEYETVVMQLSQDHRVPLSELFKKFASLPPREHFHEDQQGATITHEMPFMHRSGRDYSELVTSRLRDDLRKTYGQLLKYNCEIIATLLESGIYLEKNQVQEAVETAQHTMNIINNETRSELCFCAYAHLVSAYYSSHNPAYTDLLDELESFIKKKNVNYLRPNFMALKTKLLLLDGSKKTAREWLDNYFVTDTDSLELYKIYQYFATAKAYAVLGDIDKAMDYALRLKRLGSDFRRPLDIAEACVLRSVLEWATGLKKEAQLTLEEVLTDMQQYGFVRVISNEGASVLPILRRIEAKVKREDYNGALRVNYIHRVILATYNQSKRHKGITAGIRANAVSLSKQQKLVLTLLAEGCSYAEAAGKAGISIHTIKSHAFAAYRKLCVHNSFDAVTKAQEMGLID